MDHFIFFAIVGILLIPTIIAGLKGKMLRKYNAVLTLVMIAIIFSDKPKQAMMLAAFIIWQYVLIKGYLILRKQNNSTFTFLHSCYFIDFASYFGKKSRRLHRFLPELKTCCFP